MTEPLPEEQQGVPGKKPKNWLASGPATVGVLLFLPLSLPLVWISPRFSFFWKVVITALTVVTTIALIKYSVLFTQLLNQRVEELRQTMAL